MRFPRSAILDSGFLLALYDGKDPYHADAGTKVPVLENLNILIPWPCLYESVNTRFIKNRFIVGQFEDFLKSPQVELISDGIYRQYAYGCTFQTARTGKRAISLTDMVIRLMLEDVNLKVHCLFTFNQKDFIDVCQFRRIEFA